MQLAIPEPGALAPAEFRARVELLTAEARTVEEADALRRAVEAWEVWANPRGESERLEVRRAQRIAELRVGELLPEAKPGRPENNARPDARFRQDERVEFRLLASFTDRVRDELDRQTKPEKVTRRALVQLCRRWKIEHTPAAPSATDDLDADVGKDRIRLLRGDFRERLAEVPDRSVDLILTDPPYETDALQLWSDLSKHAARILAPRGILFVWSGKIHLPQVIERLSEHLRYGWVFLLDLPGSNTRIMGRHIIQSWKPILAFTVGVWPSGEWGDDRLISPERAKSTYEWQQHAVPAQRLIERYAPPDGLVVDPMVGVGSFGMAAMATGRRFVGVELHGGRFEQAAERLGL